MKAAGYLIFRGSNSQKDQFRSDPQHPSVRRLQSLPTARGTRLLISGWWGIARHINYFGDWLMACVPQSGARPQRSHVHGQLRVQALTLLLHSHRWSWCLPCGTGSIVPYFYVIYFAVLLRAHVRYRLWTTGIFTQSAAVC